MRSLPYSCLCHHSAGQVTDTLLLFGVGGGGGRWCSVLYVLYSTFCSQGGAKWWVGGGGGGCAYSGLRIAW